jgi:hypothetical protein
MAGGVGFRVVDMRIRRKKSCSAATAVAWKCLVWCLLDRVSMSRVWSPTRWTRFELSLVTGFVLVTGLGSGWALTRAASEEEADVARRAAGELLSAASEWRRATSVPGCPTVTQLMTERRLERSSATDDPWGGRFRIICSEIAVRVRSAGMDGVFQTEDDIELATDWKS